jgi:small-conductance mechanosensitive channel
LCLVILGTDRAAVFTQMINTLQLENIFNPNTLIGAVFYALLFFFISLALSILMRKFVDGLVQSRVKTAIDRTAATFITQLSQVGIYIAASIIYFHLIPALRAIGTAILATAGVASIVIGLAAQNTLGNLVSGISLLLYRPFRLGDKIKVYASAGDETGVVEGITLGYTILRMPNDEKIIVPNSVLASTVIVNFGRQEPADT